MLDFDAEAYAQYVGVHNAQGGRGYSTGVRIVDCPWCGDAGGHAWLNVEKLTAGCFHPWCDAANGRTLFEYAQRAEGFRTRGEAVTWLLRTFPGETALRPAAQPAVREDWCKLPSEARPFGPGSGLLQAEAARFAARQWGLAADDLRRWGVLWCPRGRYAWRLVVPVVMGGAAVQFQARSYRGAEPKYLSGEIGVVAARPMEACLFNLDAAVEGADVILVEGWADVAKVGDRRADLGGALGQARPAGADAGMHHDVGAADRPVAAVALLGSALTPAKAALLAARRPRSVTVALDADAVAAGYAVADVLECYLPDAVVRMGLWRGGKDAGSGAVLDVLPRWRGLRATMTSARR